MSSVQAITEDLKFSVRVASFYEFGDDAKKDIVLRVGELMEEIGKKHDFLVWRTQFETTSMEKNT
jgi:hypothetical protein